MKFGFIPFFNNIFSCVGFLYKEYIFINFNIKRILKVKIALNKDENGYIIALLEYFTINLKFSPG